MKQFGEYSKYYDSIYKKKEYKKEATFVSSSIKKHGNKGKKLLSLGCGTCTYELIMARAGYKITGIDRSPTMLQIASEKIDKAGQGNAIKLVKKDVRNFSFSQKFDNAIAMFNIVGYQLKNEDFDKMLKNVGKHLKKGGVFAFDCWYMPAVLKDGPTDRIKRIDTPKGSLIRLTKSILHTEENNIEINFDVMEMEKDRLLAETNETHFMRYWSLPELKYFLKNNGFDLVRACNFMNIDSNVSPDKWDIYIIAKKR